MRYLDETLATVGGAEPGATPKPVSVIGLGTWQFGSREWGYGPEYEGRTAAIVQRALECGITLFDTAEIYGFGRSERLLAAGLGPEIGRVVGATKHFPVLPVSSVVQQRALASAARLGVRRLDLYQVHQPNPVVNDGTTMAGMRRLRGLGLVDRVGVSNYSLERWRAAEDALESPVWSNQVQYSLAHRGPEDDLLPYAAERGRVVIAYSPLAQGLLSGRYDAEHPPSGSVRRMSPLFLPENLERAAPLLATLREVAAAHDVSMSQAALAYLISHPNVVVIPGASGEEQVESNAAAAEVVLSESERTALAAAARDFQPLGGVAAAGKLFASAAQAAGQAINQRIAERKQR
jgi:aryl-alcohol dehydrogenase-like predicted oxidoreductase